MSAGGPPALERTAADRTAPVTSEDAQKWLFDAVLGVAVFGSIAGMIAADIEGDRDPEMLAYLWAFMLGGLMLVRRRYPLAVLTVTILGLWIYYAVGYPVIGLSVPAAAALYSAAEHRRIWWSVSAAALLLLGSYFYRLVIAGQDIERIVGYELWGHIALMAAAIALGVSMRLRRELQQSAQQLVEATEMRERSQSAAAIASERAEIARELHDSLGHQTTVVSMHADVARETVETDPEQAQEALETVKRISTEMMQDLRSTVQSLRTSDEPEGRRRPGSVAALESDLLAAMPVEVDSRIDVGTTASATQQAAVYRIVQESLTNVVRHSASGAASVVVRDSGDELLITVSDPGPAVSVEDESGENRSGLGLAGMRERATSLGGTLEAGPSGSGYEVRARLPLSGTADGEEPPDHVPDEQEAP